MNDDHAAVTELLGAWALDACSAEETAAVESLTPASGGNGRSTT